jgi:hypothetical protein
VNGASLGACAKYFPFALVQFPIELLHNDDACGEKSSVKVSVAVARADIAFDETTNTASAIDFASKRHEVMMFLPGDA